MGVHAGKWTRPPPHGHKLERMGTHAGERARSSRKGFKAEMPTLDWSDQYAFDDYSRQRNEERRRMDAHSGK